ncbi:hypothetical protein PAXRUDRAFT_14414 [Paxillus rubicundulus Ve08.2h10]|uniref:Uncharacterized protein n=1 Tax=Paxillus rubicundulus Ve08.2h10 TaxID=930991 RepID=A0A0D0DP73_9AGAM|nr:hypothetical protein PAXRUDRAFT_14414 [Paxillus rubicundulus Ve08.2h10]
MSKNTALAHIMQMGDEIMVEPSSNPDLASFNLLTKVMVKLAKALPKCPGQEVQPSWVDTWTLAVEILFMFARHAEGLGYRARMLMCNAKVIEWEVLIDKELANLKASMDAMLGETKEVEGLLDHKLVHLESKWCSWCYTEAHRELI